MMAGNTRRTSGSRRGAASGLPEAELRAQLDELRSLIVGPEQARLSVLEDRPRLDRETVASILPEAVSAATQARGRELAISLEPSVTEGLRAVAEKRPEILGEALAPTIGSAVRRAVADALSAMLQRLDVLLEKSLSIEGLRWRLEARRTGRPFAEVALLRTLVYCVEQVFLLHSETGLVLHHVASPDRAVQDPDQVASLLQALDAFAREAFRPLPPGEHLRHFEVGGLTLWIERDQKATIAAAVRGVAPRSFGDLLRETRERIALAYEADLMRFRSDPSPFESTHALLERCLKVERRAPPRRAHIWLSLLALVLVVAMAAVAIVRRRRAAADARLGTAYVQALEAEPGTVVTDIEAGPRGYALSGFHDPIAPDPGSTLARHGLPPAELRFAPFYSLDPRLTVARAGRVLQPPSDAVLSVEDGVLRVHGRAPRAWIARARLLATVLPGISAFDDQGLGATEAVAEARRAAALLEAIQLRFEPGSARLRERERQRLLRAAPSARALTEAAREARVSACISVLGHASPDGKRERNETLSSQRAQRVASRLEALGIPPESLRSEGLDPGRDEALQRGEPSVTFHVEISERPVPGCVEAP